MQLIPAELQHLVEVKCIKSKLSGYTFVIILFPLVLWQHSALWKLLRMLLQSSAAIISHVAIIQ